ncbi:MAG: FG-GAP-like repeat-containing protein [Chitinophagales bacterium]
MLYFILYLVIALQFMRVPEAKFVAQTIDNNISIGYGLALGDVDGDGKPDILLADKKQFVWYRNGDWKKFVMAENLTEHDNVCIAARDINGDGKVEVAVGAQWNPSETSDSAQSGSVHYLIRPADPTQKWTAVELPHVPTIHRMKWARSSEGKYYLLVLPLHGQGNQNGTGEGVKMLAFEFPQDVHGEWTLYPLQTSMHMTHNFLIVEDEGHPSTLYLAGKEGVWSVREDFNNMERFAGMAHPAGELKIGRLDAERKFFTTIEPMHGEQLLVYPKMGDSTGIVLDDQMKEGHALAVADFLGLSYDQIVAGWRIPNKDGKVGIKIWVKKDNSGRSWQSSWIDENGMACEDIQVMDLDGDGKPDIVASGRATKNLKIYWNKSAGPKP